MQPKRSGKALVKIVGTTYAVASMLLVAQAIAKVVSPSSTGALRSTGAREAVAYIIAAVVMGLASARMFYLIKSGRV